MNCVCPPLRGVLGGGGVSLNSDVLLSTRAAAFALASGHPSFQVLFNPFFLEVKLLYHLAYPGDTVPVMGSGLLGLLICGPGL